MLLSPTIGAFSIVVGISAVDKAMLRLIAEFRPPISRRARRSDSPRDGERDFEGDSALPKRGHGWGWGRAWGLGSSLQQGMKENGTP